MREICIESVENPTFKSFLKLTGARGIKKGGLAILSGAKQIREVLRDFPERCTGIIGCKTIEKALPESAMAISSFMLSPDLFRQIDLFHTGHPLLLIKLPSLPDFDAGAKITGCTLLIPFQDPANVGAVIRTAAAFGVSQIVMTRESALPFHPKALRAAGSHVFRVPLFKGPALTEIETAGTPIITLSLDGKDVEGFRFPPSFWLIPGLEGPGLPENLRHTTGIRIPMEKKVDSLNAAMATGIALYLWRKTVRGKS